MKYIQESHICIRFYCIIALKPRMKNLLFIYVNLEMLRLTILKNKQALVLVRFPEAISETKKY